MPTVEYALSLVAEGEVMVISFRVAREVVRTPHKGVVWWRFRVATVRVPTVLVLCTGKRSTPLTSLVQAARDLAAASANLLFSARVQIRRGEDAAAPRYLNRGVMDGRLALAVVSPCIAVMRLVSAACTRG
jgi:hypothetical protein